LQAISVSTSARTIPSQASVEMAIKEMLIVTATLIATQMLVASAEPRDSGPRSGVGSDSSAHKRSLPQDIDTRYRIDFRNGRASMPRNVVYASRLMPATTKKATQSVIVEQKISQVLYRKDGLVTGIDTVRF
jgi:hypothetical protein